MRSGTDVGEGPGRRGARHAPISRFHSLEPVPPPDWTTDGRTGDGVSRLTTRERVVLALVAEGMSNHGIAERLHTSGRTVETHLGAIFNKLGLVQTPERNRRVEAVLAFLQA